MACVVESSSTVSGGTRTNTTITAPSGITNGDLLVIAIDCGGGATVTAPSGFSTVTGSPVSYNWAPSDSYTVRVYTFYKVASGESGNYTCTHSSAYTTASMWRISGADGTVDQVSTDYRSGSVGITDGDVVTAPTLTTSDDGAAVVWYGACWDGFGARSPTSGWTETYNGTGVSYSQYTIKTTAGATGSIAIATSQASNKPWGVMMTAFAASAAAPASTSGNLLLLGVG